MRRVEQKLSDWHGLYRELQLMRSRLDDARCELPPNLQQLQQLQAEVDRLQASSDAALDEVHSLIAVARPALVPGGVGR